jgi:hypothetical protein
MPSTLLCSCGQVRIHLALAAVHRNQCCCVDCRKGIRWCVEQGGPPVRSDTALEDPPADLLYFPNALSVVRGEEHLKCFVLKSGFPTKRLVASCCWTALCGDNPNYKRCVLVTYPGHATIEPDSSADEGTRAIRSYDARIRQDDMSDGEVAQLPPWVPPATARNFPDSRAVAAAQLTELARSDGSAVRGLTTVQSLIGGLGVGVADPNHEGPTPEYIRERNAIVQYSLLSGPDGGAGGNVTAVFTVPAGMAEALVQHPILANGSQFDLERGASSNPNTITSTFTSHNPKATAEAIKQRLIGRVADPSPPGMEACVIQ